MQYKKRKGRKQKAPPKSEFDYLYYILDLSAKDIAERFEVKEHTVYNWASKYRRIEE